MFFKKKKVSLFFTAPILIISVALVFHSCNSENDEFMNDSSLRMNNSAEATSINTRTLMVNSIAETDEFLDYGTSCMLLAEKLKSYTSTLSPEEFDDLMKNLNNDDYMLEIANKVNLEKELFMVEDARKRLLTKTDVKLLDDSEKMNLFVKFADNTQTSLLRTRSEGGGGVTKAECKRRLDEDYAYASAVYLSAMILCSCSTGGLGTCFCAIAASAAYDYAITLADRSYYDCMSNAVDW